MPPTGRAWRACVSALAVSACWTALAADAVAQGSVTADRAALEALYDATGGDNWNKNTNWKTAAPLHEWYGVSIWGADGRVSRIVLPGNNLRGPFPAEMADLDALWELNLSHNDLTNGAFGAVAGLPGLRRLDLSYNWGMIGAWATTGGVPTAPIPYWSRLDWLNIFVTRMCIRDALKAQLSSFLGSVCETAADATIDVAVVYTPAAKEAAGGVGAMEAEIDLMIAATNEAYMASGVRQRLALVGRSEVPYTEKARFRTHLSRLTGTSDGHLDEVHGLRDRTGADLVHLLVDRSDATDYFCGIANLPGAFGVTWWQCRGETFSHELGHNMGLFHDRYQVHNNEGGVHPHPAYGYVNQRAFEGGAENSSRWMTVMSYPTQCGNAGFGCSDLPLRFSNSRQSLNGDPLGVPYGGGGLAAVTGPADAAAVLNATGPAVSLWRNRPAAANRPPRTASLLPNQSLVAGDIRNVDVSRAFSDPDGHAMRYTVATSRPFVVTVRAAGDQATLTAVAAGSATVRVTATDSGGLSVTQAFAVTVTSPPNRRPEPFGTVAPLTIQVDSAPVSVPVSGAFRDPDGDALTYTAVSSSPSVASVVVNGGAVTVTPVAVGTATVTVTAVDSGGLSVTLSFAVRVTPPPNRPPEPAAPLGPLTIPVDAPPEVVDVLGAFRDPDGDTLTYTVVSSDPSVASVVMNGSMVTVTPVAEGVATVTVTATDPGSLSGMQSFAVTVGAPLNRPPEVAGALTPLTIALYAAPVRVDVLNAFRDPEGQALTYGAVSTAPGLVDARVEGTGVVLDPVGVGTATIEVTASDPGSLDAMQSFNVTVSDSDRRALEAFYDATGGPNWRDDTNWKTNAPLADWRGVATDSTGRVTELRLSRNRLAGRLPNELGTLGSLEALDLSWNDLTGPIPAAMRSLSNLEELRLYWNAIEGRVPAWLGDLSRLQVLSLGYNALSGPVPAALGRLGNLESLDLTYNWGLLGPLPRGWRLPQLQELNVFATQACAPAALHTWLTVAAIEFTGRACDARAAAVIDLAVVYTPAAERAAGGLDGLAAAVDLIITEANQAYDATELPHRLALVAREEVSYRETGDSNVDLTRLADPTDGYMDQVHVMRDLTGADLVHLIVAGSETGGNAYLGGPFSLTCLDCGGLTFTVVHGHNMGLWRDRYYEENRRLGVRSHPAYGYVNRQGLSTGAPRSKRWRTIMAEQTECRDAGVTCPPLLRFSNPSQSRDGDPLGIRFGAASGAAGPADAAAVLNATAPAVAAWRDRPAGANRRPEVAATLPDQTLELSGTLDVDVSRAFADPDGDALTYTVSSSAPRVVAVRAAGARVTLTAQSVGTATVRVTATDPDGLSTSQSFTVTVTTPIVRAPFTDDPLRPGVTPIRAVHFTELRERIDALRMANGLGRFRWTDPALRAGATGIRLVHLTQLRSALAAAYTAAGRSVPRWTDPAPVAGTTPIRAVHLTELRAAVVALE